jgi:hypothetical protein
MGFVSSRGILKVISRCCAGTDRLGTGIV